MPCRGSGKSNRVGRWVGLGAHPLRRGDAEFCVAAVGGDGTESGLSTRSSTRGSTSSGAEEFACRSRSCSTATATCPRRGWSGSTWAPGPARRAGGSRVGVPTVRRGRHTLGRRGGDRPVPPPGPPGAGDGRLLLPAGGDAGGIDGQMTSGAD